MSDKPTITMMRRYDNMENIFPGVKRLDVAQVDDFFRLEDIDVMISIGMSGELSGSILTDYGIGERSTVIVVEDKQWISHVLVDVVYTDTE